MCLLKDQRVVNLNSILDQAHLRFEKYMHLACASVMLRVCVIQTSRTKAWVRNYPLAVPLGKMA